MPAARPQVSAAIGRFDLLSKNSAWLIIAFTMSGANGLVIRKVGSGRLPVSSRSGKAVMKITGASKSGEEVVDRVDARAAVGELDVGEDDPRPRLLRELDRLAPRAGDPDDAVAEAGDDVLDVHGDQRLVLDDQHVGRHHRADLARRLVEQLGHALLVGPEDLGRLRDREAFDRGQEEGLARPGLDARELGSAPPFPTGPRALRSQG